MDLNTGLTVFSVAFGLYQWFHAQKLGEIVRRDAWVAYRDAATIYGGLLRLQEKIKTDVELGRLIGQAEQIMNNQIRQISMHEKITPKKIETWKQTERICHPSHVDIFNRFAGS